MVDVVNTMCEGQGGMCDTRANPRFAAVAQRCANCFKHEFPDHPLSKASRIKHKELRVRHYLDERFPGLGFKHDKSLTTPHCDCSVRRRLDHYCVVGNTILAVETDEYQHRRYDPADETARYHDTFMGFSGRWVWLRFNPDRVDGQPGPSMEHRLAVLGDEVERHVARIRADKHHGPVEIHHLFYDSAPQ